MDKKDTKYYLKCAIGIFIMFGFGLLPPVEPITELGMSVLGVFVGVVFLWSTVDLLWPSVLALVAFAFVGYGGGLTTILTMALSNDTVWICIMAMAVLGVISRAGVNDYITTFFLTLKICDGHPWVVTAMWMIVTVLLSVLTGNPMVTTLIMWGILVPLCERVGYKKGDSWAHLMVLGTAAFSGFAGALLPFKGLPLYLYGTVQTITGEAVNTVGYICTAVVVLIAMMIGYLLLMRFVFRADVSKLKEINADFFKKDLPPMTKVQKFLLGFFVVYITLLAVPGFLPADSWLKAKYTTIGIIGIIMVMFVVLCIIKVDGKPLLRFNELASSSIAWNIVFLLSVAMCMSTILLDESTGIKAALLQVLSPALNGLSPLAFAVVFLTIAVILTNIANNMVVALIMAPIAATLGLTYTHIHAMALVCLLSYAVNIAFILPSASPVSAMCFGHDLVEVKKHWGYAIISCLVFLLVLIVVGYPLSELLIV